ncbi:unnamed protein product [Gordionus sp. m RMFG-2023]|uniref:inositol polyphosphate 5-phosphatase OCRL-like n=1 Tax=Gordionus sp. m RMFG-2023 TaxID=3053472 RepID=UPI0030E1C701
MKRLNSRQNTLDLAFEDQFVDYNNEINDKLKNHERIFRRNSSCPSLAKDDDLFSHPQSGISQKIKSSNKSDFYLKTKTGLPNRDVILKLHMSQCQQDYTKEKEFKVYIGSWNVNGQSVSEDLFPWLGDYPEDSPRPADIVAIGFQELDLRTEAYIFYESHKEAEWLNACDSCLRKVVQKYNKYYGNKWDTLSQAYRNHYISPIKYNAKKSSLKPSTSFNSDLVGLNLKGENSNPSYSKYYGKHNDNDKLSDSYEALTLANTDSAQPHSKSHTRALHPGIEVKDEEIEEITPFSPYVKLHLVRLVGMMLVIFVKKDILPFISDIASETLGTGLLGKMGNKGGVAIRFNLHGVPMCFVNTHFAAHAEELERRNQDFQDICTKIQFSQCAYIGILDHDYIFWFGDLNYRLDVANQENAKLHLTNNKLHDLMKFDQLTKQKNSGKIFPGFQEGPITFPPTYKYDPGTDNFDSSEKARVPSWCDRILWKSASSEKVNLLLYRSHLALRLSDHKPVSALFNTKVHVIDQNKFKKAYEFAMKNIDRIENDYLPQASVDKLEINFGNVYFMEHIIKKVTLTNIGQVPIQFQFIKKPGFKSYCKSWLCIKPFKYLGSNFVQPGENCIIELSCYVNKSHAPLLNSGADRMEDILILHLEHGKDFFLSILGNYVKSCFGASLEELIEKGVHPYRKAIEKPLIDLFDDGSKKHDLTTDIDSGSAFLLKLSNEAKKNVKNLISFSLIDLNCHVSVEIWILVSQILEKGLNEPELFQKPGLMKEICVIRDSLDLGTPAIKKCSVHSVCDALIIFLESLKSPIFPIGLYDTLFLSIIQTPSHNSSPTNKSSTNNSSLTSSKPLPNNLSNKSNLGLHLHLRHHHHRHTSKNDGSFDNKVNASGHISVSSNRMNREHLSDIPMAGEILDKMPIINRDTCKFILAFLQCLLDFSAYNGVNYDLLSSIFSRVLIRNEATLALSPSSKSVSRNIKTIKEMSIQDQYVLDKKRKAFFTELLMNT